MQNNGFEVCELGWRQTFEEGAGGNLSRRGGMYT